MVVFVFAVNPDSGEGSKKGAGNGWNGAEQAFGIVEALMIEVSRGQEVAIDPSRKIRVGIEEWDRASRNSHAWYGYPTEQYPVAHQDREEKNSQGAGSAHRNKESVDAR